VVSPLVSSAEINATGDTLTAGFNETVVLNDAIPALSSNHLPVTLSNPSTGSSDSHTWDTSRTVSGNETITLSYTQPGDGIEDDAGNDLLTFTNFVVTNNSEAIILTEAVITPEDKDYFRRSTAAVTFEVNTDAAAECRYTTAPNLAWDDQAAMTTSDDLEHTIVIPVVKGGVYRYCAQCQDLGTLETLNQECVRWAVEPAPRW
jgi:hypothetical protein